MDASNPYDSAPDLFPNFCNFMSFIVNYWKPFYFYSKPAPAKVSVLVSLLTSGADIENLFLLGELPEGAEAELGEAIKRSSGIRALCLSSGGIEPSPVPELLRLAAVSASASLENLEIRCIDMKDELATQLCNSFGKFATLRRLSISGCNLSIPSLVKWISELRALESVQIWYEKFIRSDIKTLVAAIINLSAITELELANVKIEVESLRQIGGLVASGRIIKLNLNHNKLNDEGISVIVDKILASGRRMCELQELSLGCNHIGPAGAQKISELVTRSPHLRLLSLRFNPIGTTVREIIKKCASTLERLNIYDCQLGPQEVTRLLDSYDCSALTVLDVSNNKMGNLGVMVVAQFLLNSGGRTLKELYMDSNDINEAGALELAKGLAEAYALQSMKIAENPIGTRGAVAVLDALATASTMIMEEISFDNCGIGDDGAEAAGRLIMHRNCGDMYLDNNEIHGKGAKAISDSINASECRIGTLSLYENPLGDEGVKYFLDKIMQQNRSVKQLDICTSDIGVEGAMAVMRTTKVQGALKYLHCDGEVKDKKVRDILETAQKSEGGTTVYCIIPNP